MKKCHFITIHNGTIFTSECSVGAVEALSEHARQTYGAIFWLKLIELVRLAEQTISGPGGRMVIENHNIKFVFIRYVETEEGLLKV